MKHRTTIGLVSVLIPLASVAQTPPPALRFEVASIRPEPPGPPNADNPSFAAYRAGKAKSFCMICSSGTHYDVYDMTLKSLIGVAYRMDLRLIVAPEWIHQADVRFVIHAIMPEGTKQEQTPDLLRTLLEERFHLATHRATVEQTAYALVTAKGGHKLKPPGDIDRSACENWAEPNMENPLANEICRTSKQVGDRTASVTMMTHSAWGPMVSEFWRGESPGSHYEFYRVGMSKLAEMLTSTLSTYIGASSLIQITDKTGVEGDWQVSLDQSSEPDMKLPSVSASLEKQGLRLERTTAPVEKLFVDKMDKMPTEN